MESGGQTRYEARRVPQYLPVTVGNRSSRKVDASDQRGNQELLQKINELRNLAKLHSQLQAKYNKEAERAIEESDVQHYFNAMNCNKNKVEECNKEAVNHIMELHNLTHRNPDMLDLHLLQVNEAAECLDTFLDTHIVAIADPGTNKNLFVITGRGLRSANGIPKIKEKVIARLRERHLTWAELNPGYLQVDISSDSRLTMDTYG